MAATVQKNSKIISNTNRRKNRITTTFTTNNTMKILFIYTVIIASITSQFLSVSAIRCHQCNSHLDEDCTTLRLSTPRGQRDDQFLRECDDQLGAQAFCRKTVLTIDVNGEHRIVRGCGWLHDRAEVGNSTCFTADNEGYQQMICTCNQDGCNGSNTLNYSQWSVMAMTAVGVAFAAVLRRN